MTLTFNYTFQQLKFANLGIITTPGINVCGLNRYVLSNVTTIKAMNLNVIKLLHLCCIYLLCNHPVGPTFARCVFFQCHVFVGIK